MIERSETVRRAQTGLLAAAAVVLVGMIVAYPGEAFAASMSGLTVWWEIVFPALLPFFMLSELLLGFGVVHALGVLLEPLMRVLFRVPGVGGWALAAGFAAGFPGGAKAAADLRRDGLVSRAEGERLLAVSHIASPIFLTVVVAVGFLGRPELGLPLTAVHLVSALVTGLIVCRLPSRDAAEPAAEPPADDRGGRPGTGPLLAMAEARRRDGRPLGRLLGDAVASAVQSLLVIGGLMIVFSVLLRLLGLLGVADAIRSVAQLALTPFGLPGALADASAAALLEVHLGAYTVAQAGGASVWAAALLAAVVGWGGLSAHAQVKSLVGGTDLRYAPFLRARLVHAAVSVLVAFALWEPLLRWFGGVSPTFAAAPGAGVAAAGLGAHGLWPHMPAMAQALAAFALAAAVLSSVAAALRGAARLRRR
ncbi:nucleoside recognition domain-containing protein [Paenibacillus sp.]|uniref:nucleoside recognition domain-containing protein n=1 Tax=Paenibacillus sp. TaxID=58172 RepID=UPI002D5C85B3|nr:nucleoside recognition domain-containing protein [Paenibacillus sp.]HZG84453.1 nucleoside recognition domain-containing protein [Paenibacillus sp.]